ncbi:hypothetical protein DIPPA_04067 [Diplonema papillatum]|nr:hypothetical protein DIPPA_04067 [Diplonema papillatum]
MAQGEGVITSDDARYRARVMVQHYIAAQQMNADLQKELGNLREEVSTRGRETEALYVRLQAAELENLALRDDMRAGQGGAAGDTQPYLATRVRQLEQENAALRSIEVDSESSAAVRAQNEALKAKLREKKQLIASLEHMLRLQLSLKS